MEGGSNGNSGEASSRRRYGQRHNIDHHELAKTAATVFSHCHAPTSTARLLFPLPDGSKATRMNDRKNGAMQSLAMLGKLARQFSSNERPVRSWVYGCARVAASVSRSGARRTSLSLQYRYKQTFQTTIHNDIRRKLEEQQKKKVKAVSSE
jgi:hypothetical protein